MFFDVDFDTQAGRRRMMRVLLAISWGALFVNLGNALRLAIYDHWMSALAAAFTCAVIGWSIWCFTKVRATFVRNAGEPKEGSTR